jgi:putative FmdB family regulatory protein
VAVYEFKCKACDNRFDVMRPMSRQHEPAPCPTCRSHETMRLLSLFAARTGGDGADRAEPCATSAMMGRPCCRMMPGGGGCGDA